MKKLNRSYLQVYRILFLLILGCGGLISCSRGYLLEEELPQSFILADSLYENGLYQQAADMYIRVADECMGQESLQSLCFFRAGVIYSELELWGQSIVSYRKALLLAPDYKEARHNLSLTEKMRMNMPSMEYPIVRRWVDRWSYAVPMTLWLTIAVIIIGTIIVCYLMFYYGRTRRMRRGSFYAMLSLLFVWVCAILTVLHRRHYDRQADVAILCGVKVPIYALEDDPAVATPIMELYDGAEMRISGGSSDTHYLSVVLPDGTSGLIERATVEFVSIKE